MSKQLIAEYHERLWGRGDLTAIDDLFAPGAVVHVAGFDAAAVQSVRDDASRYRGAFTDVSTRIEDLLADGDRVVLRWSTTGTHTGPYGKVAATGRVVTMTGVDIFRVEGETVVEFWSLWDGLDVFDQLGVLPDFW
ncbi:ester cyclase [Cryptosporangium phraense]|uniref:Ester cyclase n=1 Tax=Cryptosporangium phraense TaxID=2593070 RepID=A0A545AIP4_9ACTN|nr:ester cyclase [Cryptosporangium phraense]TQS41120.1 ester cyclase [Cryptosporangium phraense]